jgi:hypothetical protein
MRSIERVPPGDVARESRKPSLRPGLAKHRSIYFEDAFQAGREVNTAKDRIRSEAIVMAEVKTNVIVRWFPVVRGMASNACSAD